jgi:hypothetical protein
MSNPPRYHRAVLSLLAALTALLGGCVYDASQRCGPAMTFVEAASSCVCDSNAVAVAGGCQTCAADEVPSGGKCACAAGKTKSAGNLCVTVAGLGDPCSTVTAPCTDPTYSYCAVQGSATTGTCTKQCASNTDCGAAYTCATWEAQPYCRTFAGVGASCGSAADCTQDARYCDTFQTHSCVVSGCSLTANDCPRGSMCCDFSGYGLGTLCAGACQ